MQTYIALNKRVVVVHEASLCTLNFAESDSLKCKRSAGSMRERRLSIVNHCGDAGEDRG